MLSTLIVTLLVFLYYFYGIEQFEPIAPYATIALHTVIAFVALSAGILLARPSKGIVSALLENSAGSMVARRMLPGFLIIVLLGWLRTLAINAGLFGGGFATAAFVLLMILAFAVLIWRTAVSLNRIDKERRRIEGDLRSVALFPAQNPEPVLRVSCTGLLLYLNGSARKVFANLALEGPVPSLIEELVNRATNLGEIYEVELTLGQRDYLVTVAPADEGPM